MHVLFFSKDMQGKYPFLSSICSRKEGSPIHDDELIQRSLNGDQEAFRTLIHHYANHVYQLVYGVLRHEQDAREAAHEVWIRLYYALPQYQHNGFKTWLSRIAIHKAIDWKRRKDRRKEELLDPQESSAVQLATLASPASDAEQALLGKERLEFMQKQIREMPETYRSVVIAYYLRQRSYKEIAEEQGLEVKSVESRLYRAKQWMRKHWKEEDWM